MKNISNFSSVGILITPVIILLILSIACGELVFVVINMILDGLDPIIHRTDMTSFWCRKRKLV